MKKNIYTRLVLFSLLCVILSSILSIGAFASTRIRPGAGRAAEPAAPAESATDTTYGGNIDTGDDGHIGENSGTGEFGDDTSTPAGGSQNNASGNPVESAIDDVSEGVSDAVDNVGDAIDDATGGMNVWGIVIAVVIVVAIAALIFALFSRK